jgi:HD-like signal output (HDOD) protein
MALTRERILDAVRRTRDLPTLPDVAFRISEEIRKPDAATPAVAKIVENDPTLAARFLKIANSAFYRRAKPTTTIAGAIQRLGFVETRRVALATTLIAQFGAFGNRAPDQFWKHSVAVALACRTLAKISTAPLTEEEVESAYTAGLLHDLGALVVCHLFPEEAAALAARIDGEGRDASLVEMEEWGTDHGEVGFALATSWGLPKDIAAAIHLHHRPWQAAAGQRRSVQLVHIANFACNNRGISRADSGVASEFDAGSWQALELSVEQIPEIIELTLEEGTRSETLWSLAAG